MVSAFLNKVQHFKDKKVITVPFNFIFNKKIQVTQRREKEVLMIYVV